MRLIYGGRVGDAEPGATLFHGLPRKRAPWGVFLCSAAAHLAVISLLASYTHFIATLNATHAAALRRERVLQLNFDAFEKYSASPPLLHAVARPSTAAQPIQSPRASRRAPENTSVPPPDAAAAAPRQFHMPPIRTPKAISQTLVQLDLPPTLDDREELRVPALILLAARDMRRVPPKPFIAPEHKYTAEPPRDVALDVRVPVLESGAGYAKAPDVLSRTPPRLPPPIGATSPVAGSGEPTATKPPATLASVTPGEAANVISIPDRPLPLAGAIVLPPINQVSPRDASIGGADLGSSMTAGSKGASGAVRQPDLMNRGEKAIEDSPRSTATPIRAVASGEGLRDHEPAANEASPGSGFTPGALTTVPPPVKVEHPIAGHYEVAVVQSSGVVPGSAGLLSGIPVYSVYVSVGTAKEWILQYCLPSSEPREHRVSQVIQLGSVTPLSAPYAHLILRPAVSFRTAVRYAFIHGLVNAAGRFEQLSEAGEPAIENIGAVLQALQKWEFRPASRDGEPTTVEVLLCIPKA